MKIIFPINARGQAWRSLFWLACALLLLPGARGGPDYLRYLDWAWAMATGDIFWLRGDLASPMGVPLSQWQHGPGLFYAVPALVFRALDGVSLAMARILGDSLAAGWLAALSLWWAMAATLRRVVPGHPAMILFWLAVAFLGTHLGFYSRADGSEILAHAILAVLAWWLLKPRAWCTWDVLAAAVLAATLVLIRTQLAGYALLGMAVACRQFYCHAGARGWRPWLWPAAGSAAIAAAAAVQLLLVNRWMTGSWWASPLVFGNGVFRSIDFCHPQLLAVLLHPWHGLLVYHPLYALGFVALARRILLAPGRAERWLFIALAAVMAVHFYVQAAWYCWWLGLGTFGMRGLSVWGVILPLVMAHDLVRGPPDRHAAWGYVALVALCCGWSLGLMWLGDSNVVTWHALLAAQKHLWSHPTASLALAAATMVAAVTAWRGDRPADPWRIAAAGLLTLALWWLLGPALVYVKAHLAPAMRPLVTLAALLATSVLAAGFCASSCRTAGAMCEAMVARAMPAAMLLGYALLCAIFLHLARPTEAFLHGARPPPRPLRGSSAVHWPEVNDGYQEYQRVPGFTDAKQRLRQFIEQNN